MVLCQENIHCSLKWTDVVDMLRALQVSSLLQYMVLSYPDISSIICMQYVHIYGARLLLSACYACGLHLM